MGTAKNYNSGQVSCSKSYRQVPETKERNIISWRKWRELGGIVLNKSPLEKSESSGQRQFFIG